ncbi:hypothetical protein [Chryseolinea lacunae]|uniref:T9SS C-terminal target domain-containing protein n=1 Tax=Chryseolinea lacunae TaxID=2801331 RepID=A0ABS1KZS5_9BACT|nr:hypothetical protein [Chryseolinea lacunae]MBL0744961.1 hypothetical protein [Chryseolinea lacunae]
MKKLFTLAILSSLLLTACKNLDDAPVTKRNTFMHFYEGANSYVASDVAITGDGYIVAGTINIPGNAPTTKIVVIKTDLLGHPEWEKIIDGGASSSIVVTPNGYILVGDSIQLNPNSTNIPDLENYWSRLIRMDKSGAILSDRSFAKKVTANKEVTHVDFHGDGLTLDDQGNLISLGTYKFPGASEFAYIAALNPTSLDTVWSKVYNYLQRDYINTRSVYYSNGKVMWGATVAGSAGNFTSSYLSLPVVEENSVFVNSDYFGQTTEQSLVLKDLQPSPIGFGGVGTYAGTDGKKGNIFFIRTDKQGNFQKETAHYYDGVTESVAVSDPTSSGSEDTGETLTPTRDGGFILAGTLETTPLRGNGGKDIWLIKVDAYGAPVWDKIIGGPTNEIVSSIREDADGSLVICGTLRDAAEETGGLSSIFLIRTDSQGELKN